MYPRTLIIAEAGVNHNGDMNIAMELIDIASKAGADMVKFQTFTADGIVTKFAEKANYQKVVSDSDNQYEMLKKLELTEKNHVELMSYCAEMNIGFLSTPFDLESVHLLSQLGLDTFKVSSGDITNLPLLKLIGGLQKRIILSSGLSSLDEVGDALKILISAGADLNKITVLHCTSEYPAPMKDVNLKAMQSLKKAFNINVGYSDHTLGIEVPVAAVAMGATVIEKHFTTDKTLPGPDHKASLDQYELQQMVKSVRNIEKALGNGIKKPSKSESKNLLAVRKSIVAKKNIRAGETFSEDNITVKRPGSGLSPMKWEQVLGSKAAHDFKLDELIEI
jgi:N,N'-diacetyllegionaminate synthase